MKKRVVSSALFFWLCFCGTQALSEVVKVGGYIFPPFIEKTESNEETGLTIDLIDVMNAFQDTYQFQFVPTSPKRRYVDFKQGLYNMIVFESVDWGWTELNVDVSRVFLQGGEVYITKADPSKEQSYFESFDGKSIAVYRGYHYGFADFNADEKFLRQQFSAQISNSHEGNIIKILKERADIAVVTKSFLNRYLKDKPDIAAQLLISSQLDQEYHHTLLVRKDSKPTVEEINTLLTDMENAGVLERLWKEYGIK